MAQRGINKVILIGNLGQDPETRYTAGGAAVTNISLATSETWKDKQSGQPQERTEWHRVVFFNRLAEIAGEHLKKGAKVYVEGSLRTRKWQDQSGQDRYTTEIVADEMQMLDSRSGGEARDPDPHQGQYCRPEKSEPPTNQGNDDTRRGQPQHEYTAGQRTNPPSGRQQEMTPPDDWDDD